MRIKITCIIFVCLVAIVISNKTYAQENCDGAIVNAKALYDQGKLKEAIDELKPCLTNSLDKTNQWKGYEIEALSYLALNDPADARKAAENMMELNPLFEPNLLKDPKDFVNLINSITVIPRLSLGLAIAAGINNTYVNVTQEFNASDFTKNYSSKLGWQFGAILGYTVSNNFTIGLDLNSSYQNYGIKYQTNNFNIADNEHLNYFDVPLYVTYTYGKGRLRPFITIGAYEDFLLSASSDFSATDQLDNHSYSDNNVNSADRRNNTSTGILGGIGLNYKFTPSTYFFLQFRYNYGLTNVVNDANRYTDQNLIFNYFYLDDDLKVSNSLFSIGLIKNLDYKVIRSKSTN